MFIINLNHNLIVLRIPTINHCYHTRKNQNRVFGLPRPANIQMRSLHIVWLVFGHWLGELPLVHLLVQFAAGEAWNWEGIIHLGFGLQNVPCGSHVMPRKFMFYFFYSDIFFYNKSLIKLQRFNGSPPSENQFQRKAMSQPKHHNEKQNQNIRWNNPNNQKKIS